jgi:hypothetical protein
MTKVLSNEQHNAKINAKIKTHEQKILELKKELKAISPVKQASLAQCNAMSRVKLKPQAPAVRLKSPQTIGAMTAEVKEAMGQQG